MEGFGEDSNHLVPVAALQARREEELHADRAAVTIMALSGYDPSALLKYIQRVQTE